MTWTPDEAAVERALEAYRTEDTYDIVEIMRSAIVAAVGELVERYEDSIRTLLTRVELALQERDELRAELERVKRRAKGASS